MNPQDAIELDLLNRWQRDFPLEPRPFAHIAQQVGIGGEQVLQRYRALAAGGVVSRIGAVFRPNTVGASTLAAMRVAPAALERVAAQVSAQPEVNHNYEREHAFNLWFVATAPDAETLEHALARIEQLSGRAVLRLPLIEEYHIDLGFDLVDGSVPRAGAASAGVPLALSAVQRRLVARLADGLPLIEAPYAALGAAVGLSESAVIETLRAWLEIGVIRRFGAVLRHRPLGYAANAMVVWDVPDDLVRACGLRAAQLPEVTLCYRRARRMPAWPFNLYCMLHGTERAAVEAALERVAQGAALTGYPRQVLFSRRCFTQRGARYGAPIAEPVDG
ncbi:MAG: Lrp/AsnC family transcriptional regulator [Betaproteobacteria bacterium]|nr:Lrp/AsnC family transcriptional regulator [Betaproteobacteria bacterium]